VTAGDTALLDQVRAAWAETLQVDVEAVPLDVRFFEAGGNSLLLLLLWELLNGMTSRDLKAADLFQHSTVTAQTELLAGGAEALAVPGGTAGRRGLLGRARRDEGSRT
jgi:hypothetical protein